MCVEMDEIILKIHLERQMIKKKKKDNLENQAQSKRTSRLTTEIKTVELAKKR